MADTTGAQLAALFGGGSSTKSYADLGQFQQILGANDIYGQLATPIMGAKFDTSTWSPGTTLGVSAAQAFLGAALKAYGQQQQGEQIAKVAEVLPQLYKDPMSVSVPDGVDTQAFGGLKLSAIKEDTLKDEAINDAKYKFFGEVFTKQPSLAVKTFPEIAKKLGLEMTAQEPSPSEALSVPISPLSTGKASSAQKMKQYVAEFSQVMPPVQAAAAARAQVEGEIKANNKTFDDAKASRERGLGLIDLANTAKAGIAEAGTTGRFNTIANAYEQVANLFGNEEAAKQIRGDTVLSSIAPDLVKMGRSPGAVSDMESKAIMKSGPTTANDPASNIILANKMEELGKLNVEYADFLEAFKEANMGSSTGADKKWAEYRQAVPLLINDGQDVSVNTDRISWQDFFNGESSNSVTPQNLPETKNIGGVPYVKVPGGWQKAG